MTQSLEFELAQKRIRDRQRTRSVLTLWLALLCGALLLNVIFGGTRGFWFALEVVSAVMALMKALQYRYSAPERAPAVEQIEQEMERLFGADWRDTTGVYEYGFAQDRLLKRRFERLTFAFHLALSVPISVLLLLAGNGFLKSGESVGGALIVVPVVWLLFLILPHGLRAFPPTGRLLNEERKVGEALRLELQRMQPEKRKHEDKPKRDAEYAVGDDGELVELPVPDDEYRKRSSPS